MNHFFFNRRMTVVCVLSRLQKMYYTFQHVHSSLSKWAIVQRARRSDENSRVTASNMLKTVWKYFPVDSLSFFRLFSSSLSLCAEERWTTFSLMKFHLRLIIARWYRIIIVCVVFVFSWLISWALESHKISKNIIAIYTPATQTSKTSNPSKMYCKHSCLSLFRYVFHHGNLLNLARMKSRSFSRNLSASSSFFRLFCSMSAQIIIIVVYFSRVGCSFTRKLIHFQVVFNEIKLFMKYSDFREFSHYSILLVECRLVPFSRMLFFSSSIHWNVWVQWRWSKFPKI